jgi:hypothetical protein
MTSFALFVLFVDHLLGLAAFEAPQEESPGREIRN